MLKYTIMYSCRDRWVSPKRSLKKSAHRSSLDLVPCRLKSFLAQEVHLVFVARWMKTCSSFFRTFRALPNVLYSPHPFVLLAHLSHSYKLHITKCDVMLLKQVHYMEKEKKKHLKCHQTAERSSEECISDQTHRWTCFLFRWVVNWT